MEVFVHICFLRITVTPFFLWMQLGKCSCVFGAWRKSIHVWEIARRTTPAAQYKWYERARISRTMHFYQYAKPFIILSNSPELVPTAISSCYIHQFTRQTSTGLLHPRMGHVSENYTHTHRNASCVCTLFTRPRHTHGGVVFFAFLLWKS